MIRWMADGCPTFPCIGFLAGSLGLHGFFDAYAGEAERSAIAALPDEDDKALAMLQVAESLSHPDALRELKRRKLLAEERARHRAAIERLERDLRVVTRERDKERAIKPIVVQPAPPPGESIRLVHREPMDHGLNLYENPDRAPDFGVAMTFPTWEEAFG